MRRFSLLLSLLALTAAAALTATAGAAERPKAPALTGITVEGKKLSLAGFRGRPVLINVWSSW